MVPGTEWRLYEEIFDPSWLSGGELLPRARHLPELEVQARWFSGEFGTEFVTTGGERVRILQLGVWNREAGPDFAEAAISINGGDPVRGCIELDREVRDWERHGHSTNPDYESVVLHLFFEAGQSGLNFTRTALNRCVPQVFLNLGGMEPGDLPSESRPLAKPGRCSPVLRGLPESKAQEIIEAASRFRLAKKAGRLARLAEIHGHDEALYQALAIALGYKANKLPFSLLSQRVPLALIQKNRDQADALLFGTAGFIDSTDLSLFDFETRAYLRILWTKWWPVRGDFHRIALDKSAWRFHGLRPANDPHRRVAALRELTRRWSHVRALAKGCHVASIRKFFSTLSDGFWDFHYSFHSAKRSKPMALIGDSRVNDMLANVFFPIAARSGEHPDGSLWDAFTCLPAALSNRRVQVAAIRLLGDEAKGRLFQKSLAHQQGLLQIYEDFCARDASDCLGCPFPEQCLKLPERFPSES